MKRTKTGNTDDLAVSLDGELKAAMHGEEITSDPVDAEYWFSDRGDQACEKRKRVSH